MLGIHFEGIKFSQLNGYVNVLFEWILVMQHTQVLTKLECSTI